MGHRRLAVLGLVVAALVSVSPSTQARRASPNRTRANPQGQRSNWQGPDRGRGGSGRLLWFGRAFPDLDVQLYANHDENHALHVFVMLFSAKDDKRHCFKAPPDLQVAFAGHPLRLLAQGHAGTPTATPGVQFQVVNCTPALFRSDDEAPIARDAPAVVTLDRKTKHAEMTVPTFFQSRQLTVEPGPRLRAGQSVTLAWSVRADEWCGADTTASIAVAGAAVTGQPPPPASTIDKTGGLRVAEGRFTFTLPSVRPGAAKLTVDLASLWPSPAVESCRNFHHCYAELPREAGRPRLDLDVQVVSEKRPSVLTAPRPAP